MRNLFNGTCCTWLFLTSIHDLRTSKLRSLGLTFSPHIRSFGKERKEKETHSFILREDELAISVRLPLSRLMKCGSSSVVIRTMIYNDGR